MAPSPPSVLVVDDSAVVRQALSAILGGAGMQVAVAPDPIIAMAKVRRDPPDAIVLDIEMPRMDGLTFLRWVMAEERPVPCLILSSVAAPGTRTAMEALERGAVGIVTKPAHGLTGFLDSMAEELVQAVRGAAEARLGRRRQEPEPARPDLQARRPPSFSVRAQRAELVVAVGASTGGPQALRTLLDAMPEGAPAIAIVQHMPRAFTGPFARRLHELCRIEVKEAEDGDVLRPGLALLAPGDTHLVVNRISRGYVARILDEPPVNRHRPSVDVLFRSVAEAAGPSAIGVLLTGMGEDGARGMLELRSAGAHTIAQDEATSVVFGMPKVAIANGGAREVLPLNRIASSVLSQGRREIAAREVT